ncbi:hypothetical protein [Nitrospirillum sp. BR 11828]|uniref:hypothetical protein n=1 Tax=Nitrospirillum sp. BR 11828 TaxID=3104325 RepID=UPI002ACA248F|nr:hypothetical protein [Nitrospirillum sp. BR 11828]MDZ5648119.1 hypothetical protein [Nitrospirillum sp. BR 11828]
MTTFKPEYKAGDGYAPVCIVINNSSNRTLLYDFRSVTDAFGQPMRAYGYQTSVLSTYQRARNSPAASIIKAGLAPLSTSLATLILKTAYYTGSAIHQKIKSISGKTVTGIEGAVTDHRIGAIPPSTTLYVELGSIPVDGSFNNKGWPLTSDMDNFVGSFIGPATLHGAALDAALESNPEQTLSAARREGVGVAFWGESTGFWARITKDFFNANVNFRQMRDNLTVETLVDTTVMHRVRVGGMTYALDGAGFDPPLLDYVQLTVFGG